MTELEETERKRDVERERGWHRLQRRRSMTAVVVFFGSAHFRFGLRDSVSGQVQSPGQFQTASVPPGSVRSSDSGLVSVQIRCPVHCSVDSG
ncbi:hypothetical protein Hdeb2414_s0419g00889531 [Helianthus debilis subsp. tardiflorus]